MASLFYLPTDNNAIFKGNMPYNNSIKIPFITPLISEGGFAVVNEVDIQNRDTVQYFLTFDDVVSYFYFGKGLGSLTIQGTLFSDCENNFNGIPDLIAAISTVRGKETKIYFGSITFTCVLSAFTIRASAEEGLSNTMDFNLQLDIIGHQGFDSPKVTSLC